MNKSKNKLAGSNSIAPIGVCKNGQPVKVDVVDMGLLQN